MHPYELLEILSPVAALINVAMVVIRSPGGSWRVGESEKKHCEAVSQACPRAPLYVTTITHVDQLGPSYLLV